MISVGSCQEKKCKRFCPPKGDAQCAYSFKKDNYKPFASRCALDKYACEHPNQGTDVVFFGNCETINFFNFNK